MSSSSSKVSNVALESLFQQLNSAARSDYSPDAVPSIVLILKGDQEGKFPINTQPSTKDRYRGFIEKNDLINSADKKEIITKYGLEKKASTLDIVKGAKSAVVTKARIRAEGQNMGMMDIRTGRAEVSEFASQVTAAAAEYDIEAAQTEEDALRRLKELEVDAALQRAKDAAELNPQLQALIQELIVMREGGKISAEDTIDLLNGFKQFVKDKRTIKDERTFMAKYVKDPMYAKYNTIYAKYQASGWPEWFIANESNINLAMRFAFAGVQLWTIWSLPSALLSAVTLYFGGIMPWTEATTTWAQWIYSFLQSPAYFALLGASMLAWFWGNWTYLGAGLGTVTSALGKFCSFIKNFVAKGLAAETKTDMVAAFNALPTDAKASILADLTSKVDALKTKSPADPTNPGITPLQLQDAGLTLNNSRDTARNTPLGNILNQGGTPEQALQAQAQAQAQGDPFGAADPDLKLSSSSSAASGGVQGDENVGGRRRRRTRRRGTKRSTKRSSKRSKKTKRAKRSRRHR